MAREGQGYPRWRRDMMMMMMSIRVRVFASGQGDQGSIPGRVIPKTQKIVLDASLLNTLHYKVWIKVKWINLGEGITPPTLQYSSYWKGRLWVINFNFYLILINMIWHWITYNSWYAIKPNLVKVCATLWDLYVEQMFCDIWKSLKLL